MTEKEWKDEFNRLCLNLGKISEMLWKGYTPEQIASKMNMSIEQTNEWIDIVNRAKENLNN